MNVTGNVGGRKVYHKRPPECNFSESTNSKSLVSAMSQNRRYQVSHSDWIAIGDLRQGVREAKVSHETCPTPSQTSNSEERSKKIAKRGRSSSAGQPGLASAKVEYENGLQSPNNHAGTCNAPSVLMLATGRRNLSLSPAHLHCYLSLPNSWSTESCTIQNFQHN